MRLACDTGGTFTDLVVEDDDGTVSMYKAPTVPNDPVSGVISSIALAASAEGLSLNDFMSHVDMLIHGTTHALNAIVTGNTAKTAFLTTEGHPDILVLREAGRTEAFNFKVPFPAPYIPRSLTFEIAERISASGQISRPLDEDKVRETLAHLKSAEIEAVAVCLLWSIANSAHELRIGALIEEILPDVPYTLSHQLNPSIREYRRASSTAIDASLKPLMGRYLGTLQARLAEAGFKGRLYVLTSQGGMIDGAELARVPIHAINSGPSMAPLSGRFYVNQDSGADTIIVADTGGTTYDVSLVRNGEIPITRHMWIGEPYRGHMTGFPSVDVKSVGAGGGSLARVDAGGLLKVGPQSAGAVPGPACFAKGGTEPTLTDACVAAGYIDPDFFLGGTMKLDKQKAIDAIRLHVAEPLGMSIFEAAASIIELATENMVQAIADITINQGIDPAKAVLVGGGGAAGLNSVWIARRLGCRDLLIPDAGPALSAIGALMSDLVVEYQATFYTSSDRFDHAGVQSVLSDLLVRAQAFQRDTGPEAREHKLSFAVEARYEGQVWEIELPLPADPISDSTSLEAVLRTFHARHEELFAYRDEGSVIEFVTWLVRNRTRIRDDSVGKVANLNAPGDRGGTRAMYFTDTGLIDAPVIMASDLIVGAIVQGPAIIETQFTSVVIDPAATVSMCRSGSLIINPSPGASCAATA